MTQIEVIKNVLTDFLGLEQNNVDDTYNDSFLGLVLDADEIELLTNALNEALEHNNEGKT
jgi:hypothetical protein